jgi:PAS domain S-box-containing protein
MTVVNTKFATMTHVKHNEILQGMFTDATEGIVVSDTQGSIVLSNPKAQKMFGYDEQNFSKLKIEDLIPAKFHSSHVQHRQDFYEKPSPRSMGIGRDLWAVRKDGVEFPIEISLSHVRSDEDMLIVAFIIDITERKKKDDELKKANELLKKTSFELSKLNQELEEKVQERTLELAEMLRKLTQSKKEVDLALEKERELNNLKSRFISTASHEFRTPLATIMSSVSLTGKYAESMDKLKMMKHIDRVKISVNHLTDILNDFLSLDKLEEGVVMVNLESININELIQGVIDEIKHLAKAGQKIEYIGLKHKDEIMMDRRVFKIIMSNLISNAIKYSNENTHITIKVSISDGALQIEIKDQGIGIPLDDQAHIFERFYRANNSGNMQGTGLGLNIVKKYMELLKGEIAFKSIPEKGTKFNLKFPI